MPDLVKSLTITSNEGLYTKLLKVVTSDHHCATSTATRGLDGSLAGAPRRCPSRLRKRPARSFSSSREYHVWQHCQGHRCTKRGASQGIRGPGRIHAHPADLSSTGSQGRETRDLAISRAQPCNRTCWYIRFWISWHLKRAISHPLQALSKAWLAECAQVATFATRSANSLLAPA